MIEGWDEAQGRALLGAMVAVGRTCPGDGPDRLVEATARSLFDLELAAADLPGCSPGDLAAAMPDEAHRRMAVEALVLVPYSDTTIDEHEVQAVDDFAAALGTSTATLRDLHQVRKHHIIRLFVDYSRRANKNVISADEATKGILRRTFEEVHQYMGDPKVAARYTALADHEPGTLGRTFHDFYRARGFGLPGEKKSLGEAVVSHDCCHILSGFNTDPAGEIDVAGFEAGMKRDRFGFELVMEVLLDFQLGIDFGLGLVGYAPRPGQLDPDQLMTGIARGLRCNVDLMGPTWSFWEVADEQVEDLRERYQITGVEGVLMPPPEHAATEPD